MILSRLKTLRALVRRSALEREMQDEMAAHLEQAVARPADWREKKPSVPRDVSSATSR